MPPTHSFRSDIAVHLDERRDTDGRTESWFSTNLSRRWWIVEGPNGGYVAAILTNAALAAVDDPDRRPRSVTVHYLARPSEGHADVSVVIERTGRTAVFTSIRLVQDGRIKALGLIVLAAQRNDLIEFQDVVMPDVRPPEDCPTLKEATGLTESPVPISNRYDMRPALGKPPFSVGGETALTGAWIRLAESYVPDALFAVAVSDGMPPAVLTRRSEGRPAFGVPTVDLTVHLHEPLPIPGASEGDWCLAVFRTKKSRAGLLDEDGEIWSRDGLLLAQSRQHAIPM